MNQLNNLAQSQLFAWEEIAVNWLLVPKARKADIDMRPPVEYLHLVCWQCDASVYHIGKQSVSPAVLLSATVAHLRNRHRELDPDA